MTGRDYFGGSSAICPDHRMLLPIVPEGLEGADEKWAGGMQGGVMQRGFASEDRGH